MFISFIFPIASDGIVYISPDWPGPFSLLVIMFVCQFEVVSPTDPAMPGGNKMPIKYPRKW